MTIGSSPDAPLVPGLVQDALDLLRRPILCSLGTLRRDGSIQINPMWFDYVAPMVRFSHTNTRAKFRNLQRDPSMTVLIVDPEDRERYLELRGRLAEVRPDPGGAFHLELARRYGEDHTGRIPEAENRVMLLMLPERAQYRPGAGTPRADSSERIIQSG
jgi:PPOX class probable F420-dependent enzyme